MAGQSLPNYFFIDNKIYKKISIVKSEDFITVWSYADERMMRFNYSVVKRNYTKAYSLKEVSEIMEKKTDEIASYVYRGLVARPSGKIYNISNKKPGQEFWSEDDIFDLRDKIYELAPKNKHGEPYERFSLISKAELRAKLDGEAGFYVKDEQGNFKRVWKAI